jgi:hypothetical protein
MGARLTAPQRRIHSRHHELTLTLNANPRFGHPVGCVGEGETMGASLLAAPQKKSEPSFALSYLMRIKGLECIERAGTGYTSQ